MDQAYKFAAGVFLGFVLPLLCFLPFESGVELQPTFVAAPQSVYDETVAEKLYKEVRVLCWIMTNPDNHKTKAIHVKNTWGKRCNKLLFMSSAVDVDLGAIALPVKEGRGPLWDKTKSAFQYIYKHHLDDADWFLKGDDDT